MTRWVGHLMAVIYGLSLHRGEGGGCQIATLDSNPHRPSPLVRREAGSYGPGAVRFTDPAALLVVVRGERCGLWTTSAFAPRCA